MDYKSDLIKPDDQKQDHDDHEERKKPKVGRGKIQLLGMIENDNNRQVTYSKRRSGIFKKAFELSVLCDVKVSVITLSHSATKVYQYVTNGTTTKEMIDHYQRIKGVDVWKNLYEKMQQTLQEHQERNYKLRRQIRQRMGHDLSGLNWSELRDLEDCMQSAVEDIRAKMNHKIRTQTDTSKKKIKSLVDTHLRLVDALVAKCEDAPHGPVYVESIEGGYESDGVGKWGIQPLRLPPPQPPADLSL
ncbi:hypothetical protein TIFTF001_001294 [Ficus carica]|uniref:Uncharacterized protein n=1 Tax=Ficus carica TaxID=3494 RepID=A0AA87YYB4_FICCA|nr:hypothetical protein TIFTF001_001294 [Ficus carica]